MMLAKFEVEKIKARIAKAKRRIAAGYVPKEKSDSKSTRKVESEQDRVVRLTALLTNQEDK